ncbi:hypothetical protein QJS10_CPA08g01300 [Acorus calamus]|uniref:Uncharacterized protein n=1 Tax=Acorus calamus TaxID=4465 RepID=A0AAV9EAC2_ACOCL|nr:hypothetical protein QJS10_CPA08g01300 [Acorus calamus]
MGLILSSLKVSNVKEVTQSKEGVAESKGRAKVVEEMMLGKDGSAAIVVPHFPSHIRMSLL